MSILLVPVLLAWGVFSLGATRPWGYVPLIAGMVICGATWLATGRDQHAVSRGLWVSIAMLCGAIFAQLIPLPADLAGLISPARAAVAGQTSEAAGQPLTVDPAATALGLTFIVALSLFFLGVVRRMKPGDASRMAAGIAAIGAVVATVPSVAGSMRKPGVFHCCSLRKAMPDSVSSSSRGASAAVAYTRSPGTVMLSCACGLSTRIVRS